MLYLCVYCLPPAFQPTFFIRFLYPLYPSPDWLMASPPSTTSDHLLYLHTNCVPYIATYNINRLAHVLSTLNHTVLGPAFAIHAIELQSVARVGKLYGMKDSVFGEGSDVLLSDRFLFQ
jgi:hypothetical protein